jgi:CheY-like chemotaxis protein
LEKEPENRYASALDFAQELDRAIAPAARPTKKPSRGLRVLVAEDDDDQRMLTCAVLSVGLGPGSRIQQVRSGKDTLSAAAQHRFDVFVLDLQMPDMTGIQLASALRSTHGQSAHIVVVSGDGGAKDWRSLHDLGVDAMLLKPVAAQQLISAIESATR